jgi:dCMP deaminase
MIIGVSGPNGAGKGEFVKYLEERSFYALSLSDAIRDVLAAEGVPETRERMIETGNRLRAEGGPGALAVGILKKLRPDRNYAIDSIRHPAEVEVLRAHTPDFQLVWVDADIDVRFARLQARGRPGDPQTLEKLRELEDRELGSDDPAAQQLDAVRAMADFVVRNDAGLDSLYTSIRSVFRESLFFERPSWDDYFMSIAQVVASRSNCVKRKVAAVVTLDRRIISTGYNGTPRGTRNCNEGGCPRCNDLAPGGTALAECVCSHGEENAITQASYHGVSLRGGTIYSTFSPCLQCTKMIINAGLAEVVYDASYPLGGRALDLLEEAGVKVRQISALSTPVIRPA